MSPRVYDHIEKIPLGGFLQKIHIRFVDPDAPILLVLHGGPGMPNRHTLMTAHADLAQDFVLVAWDQRGCAGSYRGVDPDTLTADRLVEDAFELAQWLGKQFGQEKVFILGGSWGSQLGTLLAQRHPEVVKAYVGTGQVVDGAENERISWEFTVAAARRARDDKALAALLRIGPPKGGQYKGGLSGLMTQRRYLAAYGGSTRKSEGFFNAYVKPILFSGEYSPGDLVGYLRGYKLVLRTMWPRITNYDFRATATDFEVPVYLFHGSLDNNTPAELVEHYFELIKAPTKELIWFEKSAHSPLNDEPQRFKQLLREKLLG